MNLAILIDAENVLPASAGLIFNHAASLGTVVHKEIYGAATALSAWVAPVLKYAIHPNLTIKAAKGKNSSDIALVIGAMDVLQAGDVDGVIIASSDSDFSALSIRLREAGIEVIGMGTDKANELWRTACTSFVVLQPTKPQAQKAQPAPKPQNPQPAPAKAEAAAPAPKPSRTSKAASRSHEERVAILREFIMRQLSSRGGRIQTGVLFPLLNRLPEYQADKKGSGKKPLNYLTSTFGNVFRIEDGEDGNSWLSLPEATPLEGVSEPAAIEPDDVAEAPAAETASTETPAEPETAAAEPAFGGNEPSQEDAPADPMALLTEAGLTEEIAAQIVEIFSSSANQRAAYNKLRTTFGNNVGREYYQLVKEIAARQ
ncbi:MAG: NYN domain-containing protein [Clostridia bacterium]|nr:NYN domain-containing protein [Clostridia bacterium]